ncbi:hypothetical protein F0726_01850 [Acidithiobacillus caldus]|nr:hypothetical protein F0726_01850 [Acidithiobacillus caldus]
MQAQTVVGVRCRWRGVSADP